MGDCSRAGQPESYRQTGEKRRIDNMIRHYTPQRQTVLRVLIRWSICRAIGEHSIAGEE